MAARVVRRSFASPFVVTLAAALPAAACYVQPAPRSGGNGSQVAQGEPQPHGNPRPGDRVANPQTPDHSTTNGGVEQAPRPTGTVVSNPPRPMPAPVAKQDARWTVTRAAGTCSAFAKVTCPTAPAGQPAPSCNPPPPMPYPCGAELRTDGATLAIVQFAGQTTCQIEQPPMKCPAGAICNPPPPQKVACPQ